MIRIYLLDFCGQKAEESSFSAFPDFVINTKNPHLKRERIFSYMLLYYAYDEYTREKNKRKNSKYDNSCLQKGRISDDLREKSTDFIVPKLERDENGRPYFSDSEIDFNLSHDAEMAALVISDIGRVGIDIQRRSRTVSERLSEKVNSFYESRAFASIIEKHDSLSAEIKFLSYSKEKGIYEIFRNDLLSEDKKDFFSRWSALEAVSKADGRGHSLLFGTDFSGSQFFLRRASVSDSDGNSYALTVSEML